MRSPFNSDEDQIRSEGIALVQQAKRGRAGLAWKRIRGLGLLPAGGQAIDSIAAKWDPLHRPPPLVRDCRESDRSTVYSMDSVRAAVGRAADAAGWTTEVLQQVTAHPSQMNWLHQWMLRWGTWQDRGRLSRTSLIVPLKKRQGSWEVRPIAILAKGTHTRGETALRRISTLSGGHGRHH